MKPSRKGIVIALVALIGGAAWWWASSEARTPNTPTPRISDTFAATAGGSKGPEPSNEMPRGSVAVPRLQTPFGQLTVAERSTYLIELQQRPLMEIFTLWRTANEVEGDVLKSRSTLTALSAAMRIQAVNESFAKELEAFLINEDHPTESRSALVSALARSATSDSISVLLRAIPQIADSHLKASAANAMRDVGRLWGDGSLHEERSPILERAWEETADVVLRDSIGISIAKIGSPTGVELLLRAAQSTDITSDQRAQSARSALLGVHTPNAIPAIIPVLERNETLSPATELAASMLANIGTQVAADQLVQWLRRADGSVAAIAETLVVGSRTAELVAAFEESVRGEEPFRDEAVRNAISSGLAAFHNGRATR